MLIYSSRNTLFVLAIHLRVFQTIDVTKTIGLGVDRSSYKQPYRAGFESVKLTFKPSGLVLSRSGWDLHPAVLSWVIRVEWWNDRFEDGLTTRANLIIFCSFLMHFPTFRMKSLVWGFWRIYERKQSNLELSVKETGQNWLTKGLKMRINNYQSNTPHLGIIHPEQ